MPDAPLPADPEPTTPAHPEPTVPVDPEPATPVTSEPATPVTSEPASPVTSESPPRDTERLPTPEELTAARDATIRHAPKFGAFIAAGAIVGFLLALIVTAIVRPTIPRASDGSGFLPFLDGENAVTTVLALTGAVVGGFVGGLLAVLADRRSVRQTGRDDV
ncbi:hypothetical protein [Cellulomonas sp. URHD0024]|uniref:hypothetical protein n=1 Tax=Cellulomonas sp. URHD0024 TaxID=1302620 RepID=UPI000412677F|nr:hypothetical protein [Cellulomonas sp. URHD0024]